LQKQGLNDSKTMCYRMDAGDDMDRLARKGLAEGLSDAEIFELLTDHDIPRDEAESILEDVKDALSTSERSAREALVDQTPDVSSEQESSEQTDAEDAFEEAFAEGVEPDDSSPITAGEQSDAVAENSAFDNNDPTPSLEEDQSFDDFTAEIEKDDEETSEGIFSKLTSLFTSNGKTIGQDDEDHRDDTAQMGQGLRDDHGSEDEQEPPEEDHDWDEEALKELAQEAIDKGLAEEEILSLFMDHGVPESYTKQLLADAKQERDENQDKEHKVETAADSASSEDAQAESNGMPSDSSDEIDTSESNDINDLELDDLTEEEPGQETSEQSFEEAFDGDVDAAKPDATVKAQDKAKQQGERAGGNDASAQDDEKVKRSASQKRRTNTVSADQLDQETLQAMAQHGIAKGFDRDELVSFFKDHGVEEDRAVRVINTVLPSDNHNTQGRKKSEHEGHTELSEAKDAVAVQKQEQVTTAKDEEESFMSDMDKSKESLKVGRIYLTGRKPSYGRMRVRGLQDITGNEFESGSRKGFIDLSDTDEHIGSDGDQAVDESQQVEKDRIREES
jgi:hypothetical protein